MSTLLILLAIGAVMAIPLVLLTRRLYGKEEHTMGLGADDIKFGQNLGAQHWQKLNEPVEDKRTR
ncbi:MAG: hypothetical protein HXY40_01870 [Chloroflexi bacterium]|nr:hypothetical protein [Chloroflexota bacterium]